MLKKQLRKLLQRRKNKVGYWDVVFVIIYEKEHQMVLFFVVEFYSDVFLFFS